MVKEEIWVSIDAWWDRHTRSWVIQKKDRNGYQIGNAEYVGNRQSKDYVISQLQKELDRRA